MNIVIFGIGGAGRSIYRQMKKKHKIIGFIDNNKSLHYTYYDNKIIYSLEKIKTLEFDKIVLGGIWVDDMTKQLYKLNIPENKIWIVDDNLIEYSNKARKKFTDIFMKEISDILNNNHIEYFVEGSSLLNLMRNKDLSHSQDIDIALKSNIDLNKLYFLLKDSKFFNKHKISLLKYTKDNLISKKGECKKIVVKSITHEEDMEEVVLDIFVPIKIKEYYVTTYANRYMYYEKKSVGDCKKINYHGIELLIPSEEDSFLTLQYGKDWEVPPKKWTYLDYGNILDEEEFKVLIK